MPEFALAPAIQLLVALTLQVAAATCGTNADDIETGWPVQCRVADNWTAPRQVRVAHLANDHDEVGALEESKDSDDYKLIDACPPESDRPRGAGCLGKSLTGRRRGRSRLDSLAANAPRGPPVA